MDVTLKVKGVEELRRELERLGRESATRLSRNAAMAAARVVAAKARTLAPVETGALRKSIKARSDRNRARRRAGHVVA